MEIKPQTEPEKVEEIKPKEEKKKEKASKGKGKSGGARVITYIVLTKEQDGAIYLLEIYDKSDASTVDVKIIQKQLIDLGLASD